MITVRCPCGQMLEFDDNLAGQSSRCPRCEETVVVQRAGPSGPPSRTGMEPGSGATISRPQSPTDPYATKASGGVVSTVEEGPAGSGESRSLTSFLSPRQTPDELGRLGGYRILKILGHGGMGVVFLAEDPHLRRKVAIKAMLPDLAGSTLSRHRFQREAQAAADLEHDNIVPILHVGEENGIPYIVMPYLKGESLETRLQRPDPIPIPLVVQVGQQVADALAAAHAQGLLHRDIKPANIWLEARSADTRTPESGEGSGSWGKTRIKLLDFGLARLTRTGQDSNLTRTGALLGTPGYMAPEQIDGLEIDGRADLFGLGCVLYRLATGKAAFGGGTVTERLVAVSQQTPEAPVRVNPSVPQKLSQLIMQLLARKRDDRPASALDVLTALQALEASVRAAPTAAATPPPSAGPSLAVLPFVNMSSDAENEFFSDGLAEELIAVLTKVKGLHVASRTSSFAFKGTRQDVRKIGEQLNVAAVLEGSVRKSGQRLRISAQLTNVADGYQLWSETFNRQMADVFDIQDEISQSIANALQLVLGERDKPKVEAPANVEAYEFYLRGRQFVHQFRRRAFEFAEEMFRHAIAIDPTYARAYAGIADCRSSLYLKWAATEENLRQADEASRKALEYGPELAEAHVARGFALSLRKQFAEARAEFETALRLDATLFEARFFFADVCRRQGKLVEAAQQLELAAQMRTDDYQSLVLLMGIYLGLGRAADTQAAGRRCIAVIEKHMALHPEDERALYLGAIAWTQLNEPAKAVEWAERALAMDPEEALTLYNVACVYALQNKVDQSLDCLERAVKNGWADKETILHDADLTALREQPRFQALLNRLT